MAHYSLDLIFFLVFLVGQALHLLMVTGLNLRAGQITSRKQYVYLNWDMLIVRTALEAVFYWIYRHWEVVAPILGPLINNIPVVKNLPKTAPQAWIVFLLLGFIADSLLNYVANLPGMPALIKTDFPPPPAPIGVGVGMGIVGAPAPGGTPKP
jgi:hypothetical protein